MYSISVIEIWKSEGVLECPLLLRYDHFDFDNRMQRDNHNIAKMCVQYFLKNNKFVTKQFDATIENYYMNKDKRLGWCINAKVG